MKSSKSKTIQRKWLKQAFEVNVLNKMTRFNDNQIPDEIIFFVTTQPVFIIIGGFRGEKNWIFAKKSNFSLP